MSDVVIKVEGLGKQYRYGESGFNSGTLREALTDAARGTVQAAKNAATWPFRRFASGVRCQVSGQLISNPLPRPPTLTICNLRSQI